MEPKFGQILSDFSFTSFIGLDWIGFLCQFIGMDSESKKHSLLIFGLNPLRLRRKALNSDSSSAPDVG